MNNRTIIFLGPTLSKKEAQRILPDACYHDPIRCGDIFKIIRLKPKRLIIIDGYFEQTGAVWHKEILFALKQGIEVYGASSMGALRAAELDVFGMVGFGKVYEQYRSGELIDDDEVALPHSHDTKQFVTRITPMVNVRATLKKAAKENILSAQACQALLSKLKEKPYFLRNLFSEIKQNKKLFHWLKQEYVDQKKEDAIGLLTAIAHNTLSPIECIDFDFHTPLFIKKLYREMLSQAFEKKYDWLPAWEQSAVDYSDKQKKLLSHLAKFKRIAKEAGFDRQALNKEGELISLEKLNCYYRAYIGISEASAKESYLIELIIFYLNQLLQYILAKQLQLNQAEAQNFFNQFRRKQGLMSPESTVTWFKQHGLEVNSDLNSFIIAMVTFHHMIEENRFDLLDVSIDMSINDSFVQCLEKDDEY